MLTRQRSRPSRHNSDSKSHAAARTVSAVSLDWPELPAVSECRVRRASPGYAAELNTGAPLHVVTAYGSTPEEAEENARARAAELQVKTF